MNDIICGDSLQIMKMLPNNFLDLTVTSPPYDNQRDYDGDNLDLYSCGVELFRITKNGGVAVFVLQDQTIKGRKTLTSFKTVIDYANIGWGLFETCIYMRSGVPGAWRNKRFRVDHEYMFIFIKGDKPKYFDKEHLKIPAVQAGMRKKGKERKQGGTFTPHQYSENRFPKMKCRGTICDYEISRSSDITNKIKVQHPAWFPDAMASDFIRCFTEDTDIIFDPFMGSGTTIVQAKKLNRQYIGIDISKKYCDIAKQRILNEKNSSD